MFRFVLNGLRLDCYTFHTHTMSMDKNKKHPIRIILIRTEAKLLKMHEQMAPIHRHYNAFGIVIMVDNHAPMKYVLNVVQYGLL